ncbi:MAG: glucosamine-6-phosphate deaminase, partial [Bacteroidia bacterium]|nr:glucosamine-6-phosphate deaminase [Bacteroidia bacterium]
MRLIIQNSYEQISQWAAAYIVKRIKEFGPTPEKPFVLGLPTGSTPYGTYKELIRYYKEGEVSFSNVVTFNMDEYIGIPKEHPQSYFTFMWDNFFQHIDIKRENANILDGNAHDLDLECENYEKKMQQYGG